MSKKIIAVAGTNLMKLNGTREGLEALLFKGWSQASCTVRNVPVAQNPSCPPQPFGLRQTREGAVWRACSALDADLAADFGVGIENGVLPMENGDGDGMDVPVIAVAHRLGHITYALGMGIPVEGRIVRLSEATGWQKTCGQIIAEERGFQHDDWHRAYTGEATHRQEIISAAVFLAFSLVFNGR